MRQLIASLLIALGGFIAIVLIVGATLTFLGPPARGQNRVPCWPVPNGVNTTIQCANGYWQTTTPEGETFTGNGTTDPNATAEGSSIVIDPSSGAISWRKSVAAPNPLLPTLEPYQAQQYGLQPRQD